MASKTIHRQLQVQFQFRMLVMYLYLYCLGAIGISGFVPTITKPTPVPTGRFQCRCRSPSLHGAEMRELSRTRGLGPKSNQEFRFRIRLRGSGNDRNEDDDEILNEFYFDMSRNNIDSRSSMDAGIHEMLGGGSGGALSSTSLGSSEALDLEGAGANACEGEPPGHLQKSLSNTVVVMDWECLLDALPYHIELGIHAARTTWRHLDDLCNFDTDQEWLENKLSAMSHVLGSPEGDGYNSRHVACEFALATRLILEEQALDRNESTGKKGKYARKFHPRSEINGSNEFEEESQSRRPLTAGELAVNWREFIRSTLIVKYSRGPDGKLAKQDPMDALEQAIENYLCGITETENETSGDESEVEDTANTNANASKTASPSALPTRIAKSLPLFPQTKFALRNSATKLVVRISHKFDNDIVARSLNKQLLLLPHERIAKTYKPENAIRRLFLNENKNLVLLLQWDYKYEFFNQNEQKKNNDPGGESIFQTNKHNGNDNDNDNTNAKTNEEKCLKDIMKFTNLCGSGQATPRSQKQQHDDQDLPAPTPTNPQESRTPSVVWIDSSWYRLQGLAPVFGDTMPGRKNGKKNTAKCSIARQDEDKDDSDNDNDNDNDNVWLSLWLAEWPAKDTSGSPETQKRISSSSENHEAAMVYPWTDCLAWDDAEDILIPTTWGSSDIAFQ